MQRRKFIKKAGVVGAGFYIVPRHVLGGVGYTAPSDKVNVAAIGAGGKGTSDIFNAWADGNNNVVALCDIDMNMAQKSIKSFPKAKFYKDFRIMLDEMKDEIDAVTVSTPDHTHAIAALTAIRHGKHVYVQKPLSHNIREARMLTEEARKYRIVSQMGNQGASNPDQELIGKWINDGKIGTVHTVHVWTNRPVWPQGIPVPPSGTILPEHLSTQDWDLFVGPAQMVDYHPLYHPFKWRGWWNFGTGALGDMGCHLIDVPFRALELNYPNRVECSVGQIYLRDWVPEHIPEGCPPSSRVQINFEATEKNPSEIVMTWSDGGMKPFRPELIPVDENMGDGSESNGVLMIGDKGVISCGTYGLFAKCYTTDGEKCEMTDSFKSQNPYAEMREYGHQYAWTQAIKAGFDSPEHRALTSSFDYAGPMTETVLMGNLAIRSHNLIRKNKNGHREYYGRKTLLWDGDQMKITNFEDANQFVTREYRKDWEI